MNLAGVVPDEMSTPTNKMDTGYEPIVPDEMSTPANKMDTGYEPTEILMLHQQG
jgi:hypothetical protein